MTGPMTLALQKVQDRTTAALEASLARPADPLLGGDYDVHVYCTSAESVACLSDADFAAERREIERAHALIGRRLSLQPLMAAE